MQGYLDAYYHLKQQVKEKELTQKEILETLDKAFKYGETVGRIKQKHYGSESK